MATEYTNVALCCQCINAFTYVDWTPETTLRTYGLGTILTSILLLVIHVVTNSLENLYFLDAGLDLFTILIIGLNGAFMLYETANLEEIHLWWYFVHGLSVIGLICAHVCQLVWAFTLFGATPSLAAWFVIVKSCILPWFEPWLFYKVLWVFSARDDPYTNSFPWNCCLPSGQNRESNPGEDQALKN
eukprot:maker-scaffold204_size260821-snap-gene-1.44 protein:Tk07818 transcript:maker-scaffold204_size260821-snap-gene-1.44-mRNA-1 annotation:"hypothetical protein EL17_11915"